MQLEFMELERVDAEKLADIYVRFPGISATPPAGATEGGFQFMSCHPLETLRAICLFAQTWPAKISADGIFWVNTQPDICFKLRITNGVVACRPAGRWLASRPQRVAPVMESHEVYSGGVWNPRYGDRMQSIRFQNAVDDQPYIEDMFRRSLTTDDPQFPEPKPKISNPYKEQHLDVV